MADLEVLRGHHAVLGHHNMLLMLSHLLHGTTMGHYDY